MTDPTCVIERAQAWLQAADERGINRTDKDGYLAVIEDLVAEVEFQRERAEAEPVAYLCPAGCGCVWRDNRNGTMSLFGSNSRSCSVCEYLPLSGLLPLYAAPRITADRVEQIKRLADEVEISAVDVAVAECAVMMVDPGIKYKRQQLDEARAALHAALDALVLP